MVARFYKTPSGNSPVTEFIEQMPVEVREDFFVAVDRLQRGEFLGMPLSRPLCAIAKGLHELRFREAGSIYRVFFFVKKRDAIYIIHAIQKRTRRLPDRDRNLLLRRLKEV